MWGGDVRQRDAYTGKRGSSLTAQTLHNFRKVANACFVLHISRARAAVLRSAFRRFHLAPASIVSIGCARFVTWFPSDDGHLTPRRVSINNNFSCIDLHSPDNSCHAACVSIPRSSTRAAGHPTCRTSLARRTGSSVCRRGATGRSSRAQDASRASSTIGFRARATGVRGSSGQVEAKCQGMACVATGCS